MRIYALHPIDEVLKACSQFALAERLIEQAMLVEKVEAVDQRFLCRGERLAAAMPDLRVERRECSVGLARAEIIDALHPLHEIKAIFVALRVVAQGRVALGDDPPCIGYLCDGDNALSNPLRKHTRIGFESKD